MAKTDQQQRNKGGGQVQIKQAQIRIVTRHAGAVEWLARQGIRASVTAHLDLSSIQPGEVLIGVLPAPLAAEACALGARYVHIAMDLSPEARKPDLTADEMEMHNPRLEEITFSVRRADPAEFRTAK